MHTHVVSYGRILRDVKFVITHEEYSIPDEQMRMMYYSVNDTGILGKKNPSAPIRSRSWDLPITSSFSGRASELIGRSRLRFLIGV